MPRRSPGARERSLGAALRTFREAVHPRLTVDRAAQAMGWSKSTLSKLENGQRGITSEEVAALCTIYGVTDRRRDDLIEQATARGERASWEASLPGVPHESLTLASYEAEAVRITDWQPLLVPGLLQTMDYTRAFMRTDGIPDDQIEVRVMARLRRQQILRGKVEYVAVIGEPALRVPVGGFRVMSEQLREIALAAQRPNVRVHVVRSEAVHSGLLGQWLLLEFSSGGPIAHVEMLRSAVYLERDDAEDYARATTRLLAVSMGETESLRLIGEIADAMEGHADERAAMEEVE
jgi:transcriptional regulator with XRE-family HTH domain